MSGGCLPHGGCLPQTILLQLNMICQCRIKRCLIPTFRRQFPISCALCRLQTKTIRGRRTHWVFHWDKNALNCRTASQRPGRYRISGSALVVLDDGEYCNTLFRVGQSSDPEVSI